jgi:hemolysin activation/secretion protein
VFEEEFADLDIQSELESYGVTLRQPVYRTPSSEFALFGTLNVKRNKTFLLGEPFSFSGGAQDGESNSTVLRFGQEYFYRDVDQAVALRSSFSFGIDAFGATNNTDLPRVDSEGDPISRDFADSQFFAWLGQAQYVRRLNNRGWQGVARVAMQFTDQPLLAIEQFSVGGVDTVRGYRENTFVRDNGIAASLELRVPLYASTSRQIEVLLVPFVDAGYAYNVDDTPDFEILSSVGVGLTASYTKHFSGQIFFGQHLNEVDDESDDLQDYGIHFQIVARLF